MLQRSMIIKTIPITLLPWDRRRCLGLTLCVIIQCILVYIGSATILLCIWIPEKTSPDFGTLARIMYLYDYQACGHKLRASRGYANVHLSNKTFGYNVKPIAWQHAIVTVSTRLSQKTRKYIESSLGIHVVWMVAAILLHVVLRKNDNLRILKFVLLTYFYISIFVIVFDVSMAAVYISHIKQSLTNSMVLRYSGWNVELKLRSNDNFAGWLPMAASFVWMRGILIFIWNIYCTKFVHHVYRKIKKREVKTRLASEGYLPVPEPRNEQDDNNNGRLYFRTGEHMPYVKQDKSMLNKIFRL